MIDDISGYVFARTTYDFLLSQFDALAFGWLGRMLLWVHGVGSSLLILHFTWQGYQLVAGSASSSAAVRVTDSLRAVIILSLALGTTVGGATLFQWLGGDLVRAIAALVHGGDGDVLGEIDRNFGYMQLALSSIDAISAQTAENQDAKDWSMAFVTWGIGGPGLTGMALLLTLQISLSLFIGLGPLFVLCLIWRRTRPLFDGWLLCGLGTMFSLATLAVMLEITLPAIAAVAAAFWTATWTGANPEGVTSLAMQQGGLGLIMTTLIISAPVIAARFFKATLGEFMPFSAFMNRMEDRKAAVQPAYAGSSHAYAPVREHSPVPMHVHRLTVPAQVQADEIKQAVDTRSFSERYPNATASLAGGGGQGDVYPSDLASSHGSTPWASKVGPETDKLIAYSPAIQADIAQLSRGKWDLVFSDRSRTNRHADPKTISIDIKWQNDPEELMRALSHEIGHACHPYQPDYSTKEKYLVTVMADEAAALMKNIQIRREILENTKGQIDIGINGSAANHDLYNAAYDQFLNDGNRERALRTIGDRFGEGESVSVPGKGKMTYNEYYGSWYDKNHGR